MLKKILKDSGTANLIVLLTILFFGIVYGAWMAKDVLAMKKHVDDSPKILKGYDQIINEQKIFNVIIKKDTDLNTKKLEELIKEIRELNSHLGRLQLISKGGIRVKDKKTGRDRG